MSVDVFSAILGQTLMGTGNDTNAWGTILNNNSLVVLEKAIAGVTTHNITGGTLALDGVVPPVGVTPALEMIHLVSGALTLNQKFQMPNVPKLWYIYNTTTGPFQVIIGTASGLAGSGGVICQIPQLTGKLVICDGNNNVQRLDRDLVGTYVYSAAFLNLGVLFCDGKSYLRADYPDLFGKIGTSYGVGTPNDGLHFAVPNLIDTARVLRSASLSLPLATYQTGALNAAGAGGSQIDTLTADIGIYI